MKHLLTSSFETKDQLSAQDSKRGAHLLVTDGVCATPPCVVVVPPTRFDGGGSSRRK